MRLESPFMIGFCRPDSGEAHARTAEQTARLIKIWNSVTQLCWRETGEGLSVRAGM